MAQAVEEQLHSRDQEDVIPAVVTAVSGAARSKRKIKQTKKEVLKDQESCRVLPGCF